jgi:hypothetical protein
LLEAEVKPPKDKRPQSYATSQAKRSVAGWLTRGDRRGPVARRFRDICRLVSTDLGGFEELSEVQRQIVRRFSTMAVWCEAMETQLADGGKIDIDEFQRVSGALRRLGETLGLKRVAKDVTSIIDYARDAVAELEADDDDS